MALQPTKQTQDYANLARSDDEAEQRHFVTVNVDPFPSILPALLNSSDIFDYVRRTGMVYPFDPAKLKSASYEGKIGKNLIYWDEKGSLVNKKLGDGEFFELQRNSIAFVTTRETFRLPNYIAVRFNLKINNVHRGLLLGTGPLVDPGFSGNLLIPLHNLTNNNYTFYEGETIIWLEFTKTSPNVLWAPNAEETRSAYQLTGNYRPFPESKKNRDPRLYLDEAYKGDIRSSIPATLNETREFAENAKNSAGKSELSANRSERITRIYSVAAALSAIVLLLSAFFSITSLIENQNNRVFSLAKELENKTQSYSLKIGVLERELNRTKARLLELEAYED